MVRDRWAAALLSWEYRPPQLIAETSVARYVLRGERHEVQAHAEIRDPGGSYRVEVGSFRDVTAAKAAAELHAAALCRREEVVTQPPPVSVAIGRKRRRSHAG